MRITRSSYSRHSVSCNNLLEYAMLILALLGNQGLDVIAMTRVTSNKAAQYIIVITGCAVAPALC